MKPNGYMEYKRIIGECPRLTRAEEFDAWERGDKELLILSQLPWAMRIATSVCSKRRFSEIDLAISAANEALVLSVDTFDASLGFRLTTYIHRPVYWKVDREIDIARRGVGPSDRMIEKRSAKTYLLGEMDESVAVQCNAVIDEIIAAFEINTVMKCVNDLPDRLRFVIEHRLAGETLKQVGEKLGVSRERVRQIEESIKSDIRMLISSRM